MLALARDPISEVLRMMRPPVPALPVPGERELPILAALGGDGAALATMTRPQIRAAILALQGYVEALPGAQSECPVRHTFAPGVYAREMTIPAGILVIGKIHRHAHLNIISKGRVAIVTEAGATLHEAPCTFVSEVGAKRVLLADTETVLTVIHATDEADPEQIEKQVIAESYDDLGIIDAADLLLGGV